MANNVFFNLAFQNWKEKSQFFLTSYSSRAESIAKVRGHAAPTFSINTETDSLLMKEYI